MLRAGNTLGVLVVQNRTHRVYTDEEVEALQTTAMVLAEMLASGELQALAPAETGTALRRPVHAAGRCARRRRRASATSCCTSRASCVKNLIAEDLETELERLDAAIAEVRASIDELIERGDVAHHGEHREVLETFRMFAHDQGWLRRMREAVELGLTAEAAVERVQSDNRARMLRQTDPYLRERLHDLDDLANRLLHRLVGPRPGGRRASTLPENAILVARSMGPAALLDYDRSRLRGLVLEEGGPTSHVAIVARALGIPAVGEVANATSLVEHGRRHHRRRRRRARCRSGRSADVEAAYAEKARLRARRQEQYRKLRDVPAVTKDGVEIDLQLNAGLLVDLPHLAETGAAGIGLFRTELQFMIAERMPSRAPSSRRSTAPCSTRPATSRSPSAPSTSAATRSCPTCSRSRRRTRRWAGARSASASTGPACCARRSARCSRRPAGAQLQDHVPDGRDLRRVRPRQGASSSARRPHLARHGHPLPADRQARRHARGALAAVPARRDLRRAPTSSRSAPTT